jgi:hypothetical protein
MKTYRGIEVQLHVFVISPLEENDRQASSSGDFIPEKDGRKMNGRESMSGRCAEVIFFPFWEWYTNQKVVQPAV